MTYQPNSPAIDLIRWTFTVDESHRDEIENCLDELGADVHVRDGSRFFVTWVEPDQDLDLEATVEALWAIQGEPFEVIQEELHRVGFHVLHHDNGEPDAGKAVA